MAKKLKPLSVVVDQIADIILARSAKKLKFLSVVADQTADTIPANWRERPKSSSAAVVEVVEAVAPADANSMKRPKSLRPAVAEVDEAVVMADANSMKRPSSSSVGEEASVDAEEGLVDHEEGDSEAVEVVAWVVVSEARAAWASLLLMLHLKVVPRPLRINRCRDLVSIYLDTH